MSHLLPAGGRLYSGRVGIFFDDVQGGGGENKMTHRRGGGHVFCQVLGGGQMCSIGLSFH